METTVKERLVKFLKHKGLSQKKFEETVGLANGYVNNIRRSVTSEKLQQIVRCFPDLNKAWLLTGEGEMLLPQKESTTITDNSTSVAGNSNQVNATSTLDKALDEIAAQRRLVEKAQEQIDRLITLLEQQHQ